MRIRAAVSEDATTLGTIAMASKASWGYSPTQLEAWRSGLIPSQASLLEQPTFVAEVENEVAGFCQIAMRASPIELEHLWVSPKFMRKGVGTALLKHVTHFLAQLGVPVLHIDSDPNAEAFYVGCGAVRCGCIPAPVENEPDRVRPQLRLSISDLTPQ